MTRYIELNIGTQRGRRGGAPGGASGPGAPTGARRRPVSFTRLALQARAAIVRGLPEHDLMLLCRCIDERYHCDGEEYVDLVFMERGVFRTGGMGPPHGHLLARTAVCAATWAGVLLKLAAYDELVTAAVGAALEEWPADRAR